MSTCIFVIIVFLANVIEGITGFAGTMLAMPAAILLIGMDQSKIILNVVAIFVSANIAFHNYRDMNKKEVIRLSLLMTAGMTAGLYLFRILPVHLLTVMYGLLIIAVAIRGLTAKKEIALSRGGLLAVVLCAGVIHGLFLSGGALLVIYAVGVLKEKSIIRATLAPVWIVLNTIILIQNIISGAFTGQILLLAGGCLIPVFFALYVGERLHRLLPQKAFVKLTYVLLILSGGSLLI